MSTGTVFGQQFEIKKWVNNRLGPTFPTTHGLKSFKAHGEAGSVHH